MGQLREELEETKAIMVEDLELTVKRGQLLEETRIESETLVSASTRMKKTSKKVEMAMCCRKYMLYITGVLVILGFSLILWLL